MDERKRKHPDWLKVKIPSGAGTGRVHQILKQYHLNTVCEHARCPNIGECYGNRTATFLIMGGSCTRHCLYCNIQNNLPGPLDPDEPDHVAEAVAQMGLMHAVITSVTRDDLPDNGALHFAQTVAAVRKKNPGIKVELLIPDLKGSKDDLKTIMDSRPHIIGHNIETVMRLFPVIRPQGNWQRSLDLLETVFKQGDGIITKSGFMIGLGEEHSGIIAAMESLRKSGVQILFIGQYLMPSRAHYPLQRYYTPDEFEAYKKAALEMGFVFVESAPLVRSSYHAEKALL